mmetsp:Transcript_63498/g.186308  ORF Transcript_63498/g.186308 Transcript_63498/m.186308 type:complete len:219 (-) Transcript_63498:2-658(-)
MGSTSITCSSSSTSPLDVCLSTTIVCMVVRRPTSRGEEGSSCAEGKFWPCRYEIMKDFGSSGWALRMLWTRLRSMGCTWCCARYCLASRATCFASSVWRALGEIASWALTWSTVDSTVTFTRMWLSVPSTSKLPCTSLPRPFPATRSAKRTCAEPIFWRISTSKYLGCASTSRWAHSPSAETTGSSLSPTRNATHASSGTPCAFVTEISMAMGGPIMA